MWFIVSAKHGLVDPDRVVAPYDITLRDISAAERAAFGMRVIRDLAHEAGPLQRVVVEVHAGRVYVEALRAPLRKVGARLHWPVKGLGIGRQLQWYDSHVPRMRRPGAVRD